VAAVGRLGLARVPLDELELLELAHERGVGVGGREQLVEREPVVLAADEPRPPAGAGRRAALGDDLADDPQRQELVALHTQDGAQLVDVLLAVEPVAARGAPRRDQPLVLEEPDLRDRDVGELLLERLAHGPDRQPGPALSPLGRLGRHHSPRSMKVSRYLPICTSSPSARRTLSIRCRFTYVPFRLPESDRCRPSSRRSSTACSRETVMSSRNTSALGARPIAIRSAVIGNCSPARPPPIRITSIGASEATSPVSASPSSST